MPRFQCKKCGRRVEAEFEQCCRSSDFCTERHPECCGQPMIEIIDDYQTVYKEF